MPEKVFVFGCPGSGKSTCVRYFEILVKNKNAIWSTAHFSDYEIMYEWFQEDAHQQHFRLAKYGGFEVLAPNIYNKAVEKLKEEILKHKPLTQYEIAIIDFARWDYTNPLRLMGLELLEPSYFLFLDVDIKTCEKRVGRRVKNQATLDDHFVSEYVFERYHTSNKSFITSTVDLLITEYGVKKQNIRIIDNGENRTLQDLYVEMELLVDIIMSEQKKKKGL
jgi:thymidylate kinase